MLIHFFDSCGFILIDDVVRINCLLLPSITNPSTGENYFHFTPPAKPSFKQPYIYQRHTRHSAKHIHGEKKRKNSHPPKLEYFAKPQKPKFIKLNEILKVFLGNRTEKPSVKFHSNNNMKYFPLTIECRNFG
jgi:hypothetical protein